MTAFTKQNALGLIDEQAQTFIDVSDSIWEYAELSLQEYKSADCYEKALLDAGFEVQKGLLGIETAVVGKFGSGHPVIGILGEYDALSGLSQESMATSHAPLCHSDNGHGCGHNLLGAGSFAAAYAVKEYLRRTGKSGTVIFYGCPGEEGGASKAFFARDKEWYKLDAALTWHPDSDNQIDTGSCMACIQKEYSFLGIASHAAGAPELGRSALDAVELMNIGVQFLREHMGRDASIHYAITDGGGPSPNVVQPHAKVLYMVREASIHKAIKLQERVDKIADAAAMMTETTVERRFIDGSSNTVPNQGLEKLLYKNFAEIGVPKYTEEELAFASALKATYAEQTAGIIPGAAGLFGDELIKAEIAERTKNGSIPMNDFLMPEFSSTVTIPGSTDVGDVSWQTPTGQINTACWPSLAPGHSWQIVASGKSSIAHKGMLTAGKVLAAAAIDIIDDPALLDPIRKEFEIRTREGFVSPIPADATPQIV